LQDLQEEWQGTRVGRSGSYEYRRNQHAVRLLQVTVTESEPRLPNKELYLPSPEW
jgi:hypothetical protein